MKTVSGILFCCSLFLLVACDRINIKAGEESLQGDWSVIEIYTAFGERTDLGVNIQEDHTEKSNLGSFQFSEDQVSYRYTRLDTLYKGNSLWTLEREKVNSGFVRVEQYTLLLEDRSFACEFGDQTSDAERDADMIRLIFETQESGAYETFVLSLEKQ